jgi:hypothetical protein
MRPNGEPNLDSTRGKSDRAALDACDALSELGPELLDRMFERMAPCTFDSGELLVRQGDPGESLFVVVDGVARARLRDARGTVHEIGCVEAGDVVGEMALLTDEPRMVDVVAETPVRALSMPANDFHELASRHLELATTLTRLIADRLGHNDLDGLGGKLVEGFRIRRCVGHGGMGIVYEAEQLDPPRRVALKMLSHRLTYEPGALKRFRREAEIVQALEHENVARLYGTFTAYKTQFLAMEFCDGGDLSALLRRTGALPEEQARRILGQIARALRYVHARNVVHRDLKPSNVMLDGTGLVKLMDFGLAKAQPALGDLADTHSQIVVGTPKYMAPEQFAGGTPDPKVDIYALGCIAWRLVTGRTLFQSRNLLDLMQAKLTLKLPPAERIGSGVSAELRAVMGAALQVDPAQRLDSLSGLEEWAAPLDLRTLG